MKKKTLLMAVLVLAIVTSLTAGTLAIYTKTLSLDGDTVTAKRFFIDATAQERVSPRLAPGDSFVYDFSVTNFETGKPVVEVNMDLSITVDLAGIYQKFDGVVVTLEASGDQGDTTYTVPASKIVDNGSVITLRDDAYFKANDEQTLNCKLTINWPLTGNNTAQTTDGEANLASAIGITVTGTQIATNTTNQ